MMYVPDVLRDVKHASQTLLPVTLHQLLQQQRSAQAALAAQLSFIQQDAMRQTVTLQRNSPVRALLDDLAIAAAPDTLHELFAYTRVIYDVYLNDVRDQIKEVKADTSTALEASFGVDYSNIETACALAVEAEYVEVWKSAQIKSWARRTHVQAIDDIDQQCAVAWHRCSHAIPWEQRVRRWYRRLNR